MMNVYFVLSGTEHTYHNKEWYEPDEPCHIAHIVVEETRGKARYLAWKEHQTHCYLDGFWKEKWESTRIIKRDVEGPVRVVSDSRDALSYIWSTLCEEHWGEVCTIKNHPTEIGTDVGLHPEGSCEEHICIRGPRGEEGKPSLVDN